MKAVCAMMILASALTAAPVMAAQNAPVFPAYPDAADSIKQPKARMNFNNASRRMADDEAFPQGRNNVDEPAPVARATARKPKKAICVGVDCGCESGGKR